MLPLRGIAGQQEEVIDADGPLPAWTAGVHHRVQRGQRDRDVRRMSGDAVIAGAKDGVAPVEAVQGGAAAARLTLVARRGRVPEVAAPDPLART